MDGGYCAIGSWLIVLGRLSMVAMDEFLFCEIWAVFAFVLLSLAVRVKRRPLVLKEGSDYGSCTDSIREAIWEHHPSPMFIPCEGFPVVSSQAHFRRSYQGEVGRK